MANIRLGQILAEQQNKTAFFRMLAGLGGDFLDVDSGLFRSVQVMGQMGFGKSTFLRNMSEAFADAGDGVLVIDIKGDLARNIAARTKHFDRLVYVDLHDAALHEHYWALNPLDFDRSDRRNYEFYATVLPELFARIGAYDPVEMQRIDKLLNESVLLALGQDETTFLDSYLIIHDQDYRRDLLKSRRVRPFTRDYWERTFNIMSDYQRAQTIDSTDSRIRKIMRSGYVNRMLIQPHSTLKFREWLDEGRLVVCNLDQGKLGPATARQLGNLILGHMHNEILQRPTGETEKPWRLIVDEATELATKPFSEQITQMRSYSVYPIIAHQNEEQLRKEPELLAATAAASVKVELRLSDLDAEAQRRRRHNDEEAEEAMNLDQYTAVVTLSIGPSGKRERHVLKLLPWTEEIPGQIDEALLRQLAMTKHRGMMVDLFDFERFANQRVGDTKDVEPPHDQTSTPPRPKSGKRPPKPDKKPPPPAPGPRALPASGQGVPAGENPARDGGAAPPGSVPVPDRRARRPVLLPGREDH